MRIELRQLLDTRISHKVSKILSSPYKTLLVFEYRPDREKKVPFTFNGQEILQIAGIPEKGYLKCYFVGVVKKNDAGVTEYHVLENYQNVITLSKETTFNLFDVVPVIS